jgi:hypothetical protein
MLESVLLACQSLTHDPWFWPFIVILAMWILGVRGLIRIALKGGGKSI